MAVRSCGQNVGVSMAGMCRGQNVGLSMGGMCCGGRCLLASAWVECVVAQNLFPIQR